MLEQTSVITERYVEVFLSPYLNLNKRDQEYTIYIEPDVKKWRVSKPKLKRYEYISGHYLHTVEYSASDESALKRADEIIKCHEYYDYTVLITESYSDQTCTYRVIKRGWK